ncbi:hypothetical protein GX618_00230 [Candidatus Dojkabacteria bacterium]|uniref:Uncharacterized protein n=1 Tax=Candidatus Dojkabacteria bacterium TaxID=2099670 RepID=A0A847ESE5_9BACT|nr:hypothetical protein [Candidatus Dojkabacteria bacterium]
MSRFILLIPISILLLIISFGRLNADYSYCSGSNLVFVDEECEATIDPKGYWGNCSDLCANEYSDGYWKGGTYPECYCCYVRSTSSTPCSCGCNSTTLSCNSTCTAGCGSCTSGTYAASIPTNSYKSGTCTYTNSCCSTSTLNCWSTCGCTPGAAPACDAGTNETATDFHSTKSTCCYNNNGGTPSNCTTAQTCNDRTCNCIECNLPGCGPTYSTSNLGYGTKILSCRNGYSTTPDRDTKCDLRENTCYCRNCLKACPLPLEETEQYIFKGYSLGGASTLKLEDFRRCTNDCNVGPDESNDDCYEVESSQPEENFSIVDTAVEPNLYDFKDQSLFPYFHTGQYDASNFAKQGDLNDPTEPIEMIATYTDSSGVSDIEGMFVWFRHESLTEPYGMPVHISSSATPQGSTQNSWGFMLRDTSTGWKPYVASFQSTPAVWTPASGTDSVFYLPAPNQSNMIEVTIKDISENTLTKSITLKFSLRFTNSGNLFGTQKASEGKYKILLMGLDKFSFTPFDNYVSEPLINDGDFWDITYLLNGQNFTYYWKSNQLRYIQDVQNYARDWFDTGKTWTLDFQDPVLVNFPDSTPGFKKEIIENKIKVSWNVKDFTGTQNGNLFAIVGNISLSGSNLKPLTLSGCSGGIVCRDDYPLTPSTFEISPVNEDGTLIGNLNLVPNNNASWAFKVNPNLNTDSHTGSITIDIGDNTIGNLRIHLTVFDDAGNVLRAPVLFENLADRFITGGGLAFSPYTYFAQLPSTNTSIWTSILPPYSPISGGLFKDNAAFSSEMYANYASDLVHSSSTGSYRISSLTNWINTPTSSLYDSLMRKYELHKKYINPIEQNLDPAIVSLPGCAASGAYCTYFREGLDPAGDLTINSNLICNKQALIFVQRNLIITPPLYNSVSPDSLSNLNGCIFVVGGTVTIAPNPAASGTFSYDKINAFIVSDGVITIAHDPDSSTIVDGVYINGGLISRGGSPSVDNPSIDILRYLRLQERLVYPVFAIDLHPKYGILAEKFFGNSYVIQSTEVGLKPY